MLVRVIEPPQPIVKPSELLGGYQDDDARIKMIIAAVTAEIDGPDGWLGRALGVQTLEMVTDGFGDVRGISLRCAPIIEIGGIVYLDHGGEERELDPVGYRRAGDMLWFTPSFSPPATMEAPDAVRIRYTAGFNGEPVKDGGTGPIPPEVKLAIIASTQNVIATSAENLFVRAEEVDGVGRTEFTVTEQAGKIVRDVAARLLQKHRRYV